MIYEVAQHNSAGLSFFVYFLFYILTLKNEKKTLPGIP